METSLHRQLKEYYAAGSGRQEVTCGDFRIDAISDGRLIEIQHGSLAAIRDKIRCLLKEHRVKVVKPIVARKQIVKLKRRGGNPVSRRLSPKRGSWLDLFDDLVYFTQVFPHKRLTLEIVLVEIEELRYPGHGRRRRRRQRDFQIEDQRLLRIVDSRKFRTISQLWKLLPKSLPGTFHTGHLAEELKVPRWTAQRIAYCLRKTGGIQVVGKQGNALMYRQAGKAAA